MSTTELLDRAPAPILRDDDLSIDVQGESFLLDLAHELRSPLSSFTLALDGLGEDDGTLDRRDRARLLRALQRSTLHMQSIVDNLRDIAHGGARTFTINPAETDLGVTVREAAQIVEPLLDLSGQTIALDLPADPPLVLADALRIRQVLVNLLRNAAMYGPRHEAITIRVRVETMVTIEVSDRGGGIAADDQERLFEPRVRGRAAALSGEGSGMGLSIARTIVRAHGGLIGVRSAPGEGTSFWFTLHLV